MKHFLYFFFHLLFIFNLFFLFSCVSTESSLQKSSRTSALTPNESIYNDEPNYEDGAKFSLNESQSLVIKREFYELELPDHDWKVLSDLKTSQALLELHHSKKGLRAVVQAIEIQDQTPQLMDRAQIEIQNFETMGKKATHTAIEAKERLGLMGVAWEVSGENLESPYQATGFISISDGTLYMLSISKTDSFIQINNLIKEWEALYKSFKISAISKGETIPSISPEPVQEHRSSSLGYQWKTTDTLWHHWNSIAAQSAYSDLVLTNKDEDLSLFVYGAMVSPDEVNANDLFKVLLIRLGVEPDFESMSIKKERGKDGNHFVQHFEFTRNVRQYDFKYKGKFIWDNGRGILIAAWTQGVLFEPYKKVLETAINALELEDKPSVLDEKQKKFNAAILNQVGLLRLSENQPLVALSYFERANQLDPSEALYLINCGFIYQLKELYGPGINYFKKQLDLVHQNEKLLAILGEMYEESFDFANARKYAELALQYAPNNPEHVINLSDALWGLGQRTQSLLVVQRLYDKQPSARLGVYLAKTYMGLDQYAEAVEVLYHSKKLFGIHTDLGLNLIDALFFLKRYDEALAVSEELLQKDKKDSRIWLSRGKIQFHLKNYKHAEKSLSQSIQIQSENEEAKSYLSATKAFLGKADNRTLQKAIQPIEPRQSNLKSLVQHSLQKKAKKDKFPAMIHYDRSLLKADKGKPWIRTEELFMEILDQRGTAIYQEFAFDFLPGFDRLFLNALEVYDSNMKLKYKASLQNAYITYATEIGANNESQTAHFPLPPLEVGDFIYYQISRLSLENKGIIPYTNYVSSKDIPVGETSFKIYADTSRFVTEEYGPLQRIDYANAREWKIQEPVVIRQEMYMPVYRDFGAGLLLTGKQEWKAVGEDYENMIRHQFKTAISVREKAIELKGSRLQKEAIQEIIRFVREQIRYRDVAFGGHSLIPQTSELTLREHRGDCKDQSLLLKEMLGVIGVPSHLVAIHLSEAGFDNLPTIQQFNHMILYIPAGEKYPEMWVDPTDQFGNDRPIPLDMEAKVALIIDGEKSRVVTTPILEDDQEHKVHIHHQLFIKPNGELEFRDSLNLEGKFASYLRNKFYGKDTKHQEELLENLLMRGIPDVSISQVKTENMHEFDKPFILIAIYNSKGYFGKSDGGIKGRFPNIWEEQFMRLPKLTKRHHPIRIPHETHFEISFDIQMTSGNLDIQYLGKAPTKLDYIEFQKEQNKIKWTNFAIYADPSEYNKLREEWLYLLSETSPLLIGKP